MLETTWLTSELMFEAIDDGKAEATTLEARLATLLMREEMSWAETVAATAKRATLERRMMKFVVLS